MIKNIPLRNPELTGILDEWLWFYENREDVKKHVRLKGAGQSVEKWTGERRLSEIMDMGSSHEGYPDCLKGYSLEGNKLTRPDLFAEFRTDYEGKTDAEKAESNEWIMKCAGKYSKLNEKTGNFLSIRNNALTVLYPPGGFISWHNNANAPAYNFIFTWSETGEGRFRYVDGVTGEEVVLEDEKGWNCKAGYFASYDEHESRLCYHAAETECWRFTLGYMLERGSRSMEMQETVATEIESV